MAHLAGTQARRMSRIPTLAATLSKATAGSTMAPRQRRRGRSATLFVLVIGLMVALIAPAAAATNRIAGVGVFDVGCPADPPAGYEEFDDYPPIVMTGSLEGCWYTKIVTSKDNGGPSGVYKETGEEVFIGSLDGGPVGTFETTYHFNSKWDPDVAGGSEVHGRCEHPIVAGSGTGGFEGATGRLDFKDDVVNAKYIYRGHITLR